MGPESFLELPLASSMIVPEITFNGANSLQCEVLVAESWELTRGLAPFQEQRILAQETMREKMSC